MRNLTLRLAFWIGLLVSLTACQVLQAAPSFASANNNVLFQDDFSNPSSGWDRHHDDTVSLDYENGLYHIVVNLPNYDAWSNPGLNFTDVRIEVDAGKVAGPDDNDFGVICRYNPAGPDFYAFLISSDGYYGILKHQSGKQTLLHGPKMDISPAIATGVAENHITAICAGPTLTLIVNGVQLATVQDNDFASGDIGLIAGTFEEPGTSILFDNLSVLQP